jgi:hypothetical protein
MPNVLADQLDDARRTTPQAIGFACEAQLRAAAGTRCQSRPGEISATTVLGVLGADDRPRFEALVADIAHASNLDVDVRYRVGAFLVRFTRHETPSPLEPEPAAAESGLSTWLTRLRWQLPAGH